MKPTLTPVDTRSKKSPEGPSPSLRAAQRQISELFISATEVMGMPRSIGEIYGLLFSAPRPLTFQEVTDQLGLSKGSVSQGLKSLQGVGAVRKTYVAGDRRDYFEPETELRNLVAGLLRDRIHPHLGIGQTTAGTSPLGSDEGGKEWKMMNEKCYELGWPN